MGFYIPGKARNSIELRALLQGNRGFNTNYLAILPYLWTGFCQLT